MARITVVNDNREFLELIGEILNDDQHHATLVDGDLPDALDRIRDSGPDVLMIDLRLGEDELHGWAIAQQVRRDPQLDALPILVCSADIHALAMIEEQLAESHNVVAMSKPFSLDAFTAVIEKLSSESNRNATGSARRPESASPAPVG